MLATSTILAMSLAGLSPTVQSLWGCIGEVATKFDRPVILEWTGRRSASLPPRSSDESDREFLDRLAAAWDYELITPPDLPEKDLPPVIVLSPRWVSRQFVQYDLLQHWSSSQVSPAPSSISKTGERCSIQLREGESLSIGQLVQAGFLGVRGSDPCFPDSRFIISANDHDAKAIADELMRCLGATVGLRAGDPWLVVDPKTFRQKRVRLALEYVARASDKSEIDVLSARCEATVLPMISDEDLAALFSSWSTYIYVNADPDSQLEKILNARWQLLVETLRRQGELPPELSPSSKLQAWMTGKGNFGARAEGKDGRSIIF